MLLFKVDVFRTVDAHCCSHVSPRTPASSSTHTTQISRVVLGYIGDGVKHGQDGVGKEKQDSTLSREKTIATLGSGIPFLLPESALSICFLKLR